MVINKQGNINMHSKILDSKIYIDLTVTMLYPDITCFENTEESVQLAQ